MSPFTTVLEAMRAKGIAFEEGLSTAEFAATESRYEFRFPPDLREFLSIALPVSEQFPNWRKGTSREIDGDCPIDLSMDWPYRGMCFDIEKNGFWMRDWGPKPDDLQHSLKIARDAVKAAPRLIPVFSHRYLPAEPLAPGNPVLSVYQTDIIYYGSDLASYWVEEFKLAASLESKEPRRIRFWSAIIDGMDADQKPEAVSES